MDAKAAFIIVCLGRSAKPNSCVPVAAVDWSRSMSCCFWTAVCPNQSPFNGHLPFGAEDLPHAGALILVPAATPSLPSTGFQAQTASSTALCSWSGPCIAPWHNQTAA